MNQQKESLEILRRAGEKNDNAMNIGEVALALASLEDLSLPVEKYREHLAILVEQIKREGPASRTEDQLRHLRKVLVVQNKYQGDDKHTEKVEASNLMYVIDHRAGSPTALGIIYLHVAEKMGWAMTGLDLGGHFLLRLSARDGSVIFDPFRAAQQCQIEEVDPGLFEDDIDDADIFDLLDESHPMDYASEVLQPLSKRDVLLRLQTQVKRRQLAEEQLEPAIKTIQRMILFAPRHQELWKEMGYLQAERGQIRAAITALEVVRDLSSDPAPLQQTDGMIRELRWRLN